MLAINYTGAVTEYWQQLTEEQRRALVDFCRARSVLDLGAGFGTLADFLIENGAVSALCVDKENFYLKKDRPEILWLHRNFTEFLQLSTYARFDIGIISWPANNNPASIMLVEILKRCEHVVYIGTNQGGTQCGTAYLWHYLASREGLQEMPGRSTLLVYGPNPRKVGTWWAEDEIAGMGGEGVHTLNLYA